MFKRWSLSNFITAVAISATGILATSGGPSTAAAQEQQRGMIKIAAANAPIGYGEAVTPGKIHFIDWPNWSVPEGAFLSLEQLTPSGQAHIALRPIGANEPILASELSGDLVTAAEPDDATADMERSADALDAMTAVSGPPSDAGVNPDGTLSPNGQLKKSEANSITIAGLVAALVSIIPAFIAYRLVAGPAPVSRARKYAAWASITAVAAYIKIIGDLVLGTFNGITVVQSVSMGVWAVIFMAVAYFIGHVCDKSSETGGARSAPSGLAQQPSPLPPAEDLLVARFASRSQITMNHAQRRIAIIGLLSLAAILAVIFVRIGEVSDYKNAILVLRLSEIDNPNAGFPYQPLTIGWGLIARTGLAGIFCGIVLPLVLVFAALFVKQGMK